jgi:hypothetical protein
VERVASAVGADVPFLAQDERDRLGAASNSELAEDSLNVRRRRRRTDHQAAGDLILGEPSASRSRTSFSRCVNECSFPLELAACPFEPVRSRRPKWLRLSGRRRRSKQVQCGDSWGFSFRSARRQREFGHQVRFSKEIVRTGATSHPSKG